MSRTDKIPVYTCYYCKAGIHKYCEKDELCECWQNYHKPIEKPPEVKYEQKKLF